MSDVKDPLVVQGLLAKDNEAKAKHDATVAAFSVVADTIKVGDKQIAQNTIVAWLKKLDKKLNDPKAAQTAAASPAPNVSPAAPVVNASGPPLPALGGPPPPGSGVPLPPGSGKPAAGHAAATAALTSPKPTAKDLETARQKHGARLAAASRKLRDRAADRNTIRAPLDPAAREAAGRVGAGGAKEGARLLAALDGFAALGDDRKNSDDALARLSELCAAGTAFLAAQGGDTGLTNQVKAATEAAVREHARLAKIHATMATLTAGDQNQLRTTHQWNAANAKVRLKGVADMADADRPAGHNSPDRLQDSARQIRAFTAQLYREVDRSDAFAELVCQAMAGDRPIDMCFGKNTVGFYDAWNGMGVDVDDLVSLPDDPKQLPDGRGGTTRGGVTKGEIMAHVLEERMVGKQSGVPVDYETAHNACLGRADGANPGSFQNLYRRERGIPADSIIFDACSHDHTKAGCQCFEALDTQCCQTAIHDIPVAKAKKAVNEPDINRPQAVDAEIKVLPGDLQSMLDARVAVALKAAKSDISRNYRKSGLSAAWSWSDAMSGTLRQALGLAIPDEKARKTRQDEIGKELAAWDDLCKRQKVETPEITEAREQANKFRTDRMAKPGVTPEEVFLDNQRKSRPAVINTGSKADGKSNCALCTTGALFNMTSEQASVSGQKLAGSTSPDPSMQDPGLFLNTVLLRLRGAGSGSGNASADADADCKVVENVMSTRVNAMGETDWKTYRESLTRRYEQIKPLDPNE